MSSWILSRDEKDYKDIDKRVRALEDSMEKRSFEKKKGRRVDTKESSLLMDESQNRSIEALIEDGYYWMVFSNAPEEEPIPVEVKDGAVWVIGVEMPFEQSKCILLDRIYPPVFDN